MNPVPFRAGYRLSAASVMLLSSALRAAQPGQPAEQIVVTGSRLPAGFKAPTPLTVLGSQAIEDRSPATMGEVLQQIPSFGPMDSPNTAGVNSRGGGQINPDLRGLGSTRTLVLINGRRHVPTAATGSVDVKVVPTLLVDRVEVVTGGASAAYGSDAVSGVVNIVLKKKLTGIRGTVQGGISERGDGEEHRLSLAAGTSFAGGHGRVMAGFDYVKIGGIGTQLTRSWGLRDVGLITNPAFPANGLPNFIISPNVHSAITTPGGLIVSGPLRGIAFGPFGTTYNYSFGQVFGSTMIGGHGVDQNENLLALLGTPIESVNALASAKFDLTPDVRLFTEFSGGFSDTGGASQEPRDRGNLVIRRDNAFLPAAVRDLMIANNLQTITIGRVSNDIGKIRLDRDDATYEAVAGLTGHFGAWTADASVQYGKNIYDLDFGPNNRKQLEYLNAVDAVVDQTTGQIVCRSRAPGCIAVNVFADGSLAVNPYVNGTAHFRLVTTQSVAAANLRGTPFSTWAGPVALAIGAEARRDHALGTSDPISQRVNANGSVGGWILGNQLPEVGTIKVFETYAEAQAPIARGLDLNGAVRRTHYSLSGTVYTWKAGATYEPLAGLRFRATRSRDIRAPNISELFENGGSSNTNVFDPVLGRSVQIREISAGNPNLEPEKADTLTAGASFQPSFVPRLTASIDYYDIKIKDAIATLGAPTLAQGCFAGNALYCQSITFNPDGSIAFITNTRLNLAQAATRGVDFELNYSQPQFLGGRLSAKLLATRVLRLTSTTPAGVQDRLGQVSNFNRTGGVPKWTADAFLDFDRGPAHIGLQARFVGPDVFSTILHEGSGANSINRNSVPAFLYLNPSASYRLALSRSRSVELFGSINNVLDKDPPMIPSGAAGGINESSTNGQFYDVVGRFFRFGARFTL
ncbi:TonB-dependent receptor domain-containing protein [Sphingomonas flavescens]|uniref:TonB-dependent receptor domain-containing protein n=1 Tax=Sphingomonas flavescens TaxID=3132797 RepID=UPI002804663E|nr:TonB-dependent receptor [Sphingomonas limnosediminicola]